MVLERQRRTSVDGSASAVTAHDKFAEWLVDTVISEPVESEVALEALEAATEAVVPELLLRRANSESDSYGPPSHRVAILAWFSKRPEIEAGDVLEWAKAQVLEVIETHSSLAAWHSHALAEDEAEQARQRVDMAEIEARAAAARAEADQAIQHAESMARIVAAELSRRTT